MKHVLPMLIAFTSFGLSSIAAAADLVPTPTGNYCKDQAIAFMKSQFGDDVKIKDIVKDKHSEQEFDFWIYSDLCKGAFVMSFSMSDRDCTIAHYGSVPTYWSQVYGRGSCKQLLPQPVHPHSYE